MEILRRASKTQLKDELERLKYIKRYTVALPARRIDNIVDNYREHDPVENRDYIVRLRSKYNCDKQYSFSNELLFYEEDRGNYCWMMDWYEGQSDIDVIWIVPIDQLQPKTFEEFLAVEVGVTLQEQLDYILRGVETWCRKCNNHCMCDVVVHIEYKRGDEWYDRNEFIEFDGNRMMFEWLHKWWEKFDDISEVAMKHIIDVDNIEFTGTAGKRFMNDDDPSYIEAINTLNTFDEDTFKNHVYRRFDTVLKRFAHENDCMEEELIVLWSYKQGVDYVLRQDVFVYRDSALSAPPEKMYQQMTGLPMADLNGIEIWAIELLRSVTSFTHWFARKDGV
jgi:hypothetical protein